MARFKDFGDSDREACENVNSAYLEEDLMIFTSLKLAEMMEAANLLMEERIGRDWRNVNDPIKEYSLRRHLRLELGELMDEFPHKFWEKQKVNKVNVLIELADVWHFVLLELLSTSYGDILLTMNRTISDIRNKIMSPKYYGFNKTIVDIDNLMFVTEVIDIESIIGKLVTIQLSLGIGFNIMERVISGKVALALVRKGVDKEKVTYNRTWGKKEDYEVMMDLIEGNKAVNILSLKSELETIYKKTMEEK